MDIRLARSGCFSCPPSRSMERDDGRLRYQPAVRHSPKRHPRLQTNDSAEVICIFRWFVRLEEMPPNSVGPRIELTYAVERNHLVQLACEGFKQILLLRP